MPDTDDDIRLGVYLSHSWRPRDVELNLDVWSELCADCELLVDAPQEPGAKPPYYINRIEELLRRTDLFVGILTEREPSSDGLRCSPYSLFEIRLADRADLPRLILYERGTGFKPPKQLHPWEAYVPFNRLPKDHRADQRQWGTSVRPRIDQWKKWVSVHVRPRSYEQSTTAAVLSPSRKVYEEVGKILKQAGYDPTPFGRSSTEVFRLLREAGLLVADILEAAHPYHQLYAAAHALCIPSIRLAHAPEGQTVELPWILLGEPGGYQHDIVQWTRLEELTELITPRAEAMFGTSPALRDADGAAYLQSKRYSQFFVFISHTLKPPHRALVEEIYRLLREQQVTPFEYHAVNDAGVDWRTALNEQLAKTTHFVALFSDGYELSQTCVFELEAILARGNQVKILPFLAGGRSVPNPSLSHMHHRLLDGTNPASDARQVADRVMDALKADLTDS